MQLKELFAPISGAVAGAAAHRTVLPFAMGPAAPAASAPDPTAVMNAFRRLQESSNERPVPFPAPQLAPQRRQPSARLTALRRNGIVETADQGAVLLRQVKQGALTASDAAASFATTLKASPFSTKATGQLGSEFSTALQAVDRSRTLQRAAPTPPSQNHVAPAEVGLKSADGAPLVNVVRDGKADRRTPQGLLLEDIADATGQIRQFLTKDQGRGRSILDGLQVFGSAADELIAHGVRKIPLIGEQAAQGREELNATMSEIFGHVSDASRRRFEQLAERHNLSEEDAKNLGALGEALPQVLGVISGPGRRRRRGDGHDGEDGSGDDPGTTSGTGRTGSELQNQLEEAATRQPNASVGPPVHLLDLPDDVIGEIRSVRNVPNINTIAAARTDIPGLEGKVLEGFSPLLRKQAQPPMKSLDEHYTPDRRVKSPFLDPRHTRHAEEDVFNNLDRIILQSDLLSADLEGRTVSILISHPRGVCDPCLAGIKGLSELPESGVVKQFSELYPSLIIRIRAAKGREAVQGKADVLSVKNGKWVR